MKNIIKFSLTDDDGAHATDGVNVPIVAEGNFAPDQEMEEFYKLHHRA